MSVDETVGLPPVVEGPVAEPNAGEVAPAFRPHAAGWVVRGVVMAAVAALVLLLPATKGNVDVHIYTQAVIYAIIGLSLNVLLGYTGQISLGHQAFVGIGAFTSAYMVTVHGQPFVAAIGMAMVVGGLQALLLGAVSLRVTGLYFALVTLAYGTMAEESLFNIQTLTGGSAGQPAPKPAGFTTDLRYYYLCLAFLAGVLWVDWRLMKTKGGRALSAIRENPRVAATFGTDVKVYTLMAFVVAGVFAGLGGALLAHNDTFVVRDLFNFQVALVFVIMTVVGGLRNRTGVVLGSAFFALVGPVFFDKLFSHGLSVPGLKVLPKEYAPIVIGPMLLLFTLTRHPGGVGQQIRPLQRWLRGGRFTFKDIHDAPTSRSGERVSDVRA